MNEKFILDVTSGYRMMWYNKSHPNAIYLDKRSECNPDIVGDYRDLSRFEDESFRLVIFDPNHRVGTNPPKGFLKSYGEPLQPETWQSEFRQAYREFMRVLKPYGILLFKWTTYRIAIESVLKCFPDKPIIRQKTTGHQQKKHSKTYWFCFMKIPEETK